MNGWIQLHRSFLNWEWYDCPNTSRLFIHCLLRANHKNKKYRGTIINRGSFLTSYEILSIETGLGVQAVRTSLDKLDKTGELTRQSTRKGTKITICNYDTYQNQEADSNIQSNKQVTNNQQTSNKQVTTNNNDNNINNDNNDNKKDSISSDVKRHSNNLDFDYEEGIFKKDIPEQWFRVWIEAYPAVNILDEEKRARAWLFANPKKRKQDHKGFLNNWFARCQKQGGNIQSNKIESRFADFVAHWTLTEDASRDKVQKLEQYLSNAPDVLTEAALYKQYDFQKKNNTYRNIPDTINRILKR